MKNDMLMPKIINLIVFSILYDGFCFTFLKSKIFSGKSLVRYPPHQSFSIVIIRKLDMKTATVMVISM